jgi:hypothetical protein
MILEAANAEGVAPMRRSTAASVPGAAPAEGSSAGSSAPAPAVSPSPQFSTDMKVDDQHQIYYEFVEKSTGDVLFEIPPEALREIGESLNVSLIGDASGHSVDVKS